MKNSITTIVGRKGSGKSTLVHELIREYRRLVIFDPRSEYGGKDGLIVATGFEQSMSALEAASHVKEFRIAMRLEEDRHALAAASVLYEFRKIMVVVEEASEYIKPSLLPRPFKKLVLQGRHHEISQIYVAQRPSLLNRSVTSQSDLVVTFQQHGRPDIEYLRDVFGDAAERARDLEPFAIMAAGPGLDRAPRAVRARLRAA